MARMLAKTANGYDFAYCVKTCCRHFSFYTRHGRNRVQPVRANRKREKRSWRKEWDI